MVSFIEFGLVSFCMYYTTDFVACNNDFTEHGRLGNSILENNWKQPSKTLQKDKNSYL